MIPESGRLDLRACEEALTCSCGWSTEHPEHAAHFRALLAHCRALRAALQQARPFIIRERRPTTLAQLDAVLAQAIDGET